MADTSIEWTERSWNPIVGCSLATPGCTNCYAMAMAARIERMGTAPHYAGLTQQTKAGAVWTGKLAQAPEHVLLEPLRRKKPTTYFVNSMGDLFHEDVPDAWIDRVFAIMALTPQHTFQVLTKRAVRMRAYLSEPLRHNAIELAAERLQPSKGTPFSPKWVFRWPLPNVWLGSSAEDQKRADERIPELLATPAAIRFVSAEPLLGPIDFTTINHGHDTTDALSGEHVWGPITNARKPPGPKLDWIIVGGESGPNARPMHPAWARSIRDQCAAAGTAFFFKQWGEWSPHTAALEDAEGSIRTTPRGGVNWQAEKPGGAFGVFRVGKKAAGRLLDGVEHNAMPERQL